MKKKAVTRKKNKQTFLLDANIVDIFHFGRTLQVNLYLAHIIKQKQEIISLLLANHVKFHTHVQPCPISQQVCASSIKEMKLIWHTL